MSYSFFVVLVRQATAVEALWLSLSHRNETVALLARNFPLRRHAHSNCGDKNHERKYIELDSA